MLQINLLYRQHNMSQPPVYYLRRPEMFTNITQQLPYHSTTSTSTVASRLTLQSNIDVNMAPEEPIDSMVEKMRIRKTESLRWLHARNQSWSILLYHVRQEVFSRFLDIKNINVFNYATHQNTIADMARDTLNKMIDRVIAFNSAEESITFDHLAIYSHREFLSLIYLQLHFL